MWRKEKGSGQPAFPGIISRVPRLGVHGQGASVTCHAAAEPAEVRNVALLVWEHVAGDAKQHV